MAGKADDIHLKKERLINEAVSKMQGRATTLQVKLFELIVEEYLPLFETVDGVVTNSTTNFNLLSKLDAVFEKFTVNFQIDAFAGLANSMTETAILSGDYYVALGFEKKVVDGIRKNKINIEQKLGITPKGRLVKKGYLYNLAESAPVREQLKQYVVTNITNQTPYTEYLRGFRNMVKGTRGKVPNGFDGVLQSYYDQYVYDSFNNVDASVNAQYADGLGLKHFVYTGSLIATSRAFCVKRAGKAFSVSETKDWKNDSTLPVSKGYPRETYKPIIERGRFRCRHFIKYITEELYKQLKDK